MRNVCIVALLIPLICCGGVSRDRSEVDNIEDANHLSVNASEVPSGNFFIEFDFSNPIHQRLKTFVSNSIAHPDLLALISRNRYLVTISQVGNRFKGIYFVDIEKNKFKKVLSGEPNIEKVFYYKGSPLWLFFTTTSFRKGIMIMRYSVMVFQSHNDLHDNEVVRNNKHQKAKVSPRIFRLLEVTEDGESGLCGGVFRAQNVGLDAASRVSSYFIEDINNDKYQDITFNIETVNCNTAVKENISRSFIYYAGQFVES